MPPPSHLLLPDRDANTYYVVRPVETLRYLGFFIHHRLKWEPHVRIMCNRARASIKALQVLGNTIRGLSMANWRIVLNAICLPVMTWGVQLWYRTGGAKGLIAMLQRVQNDMVKVVAGAFHMAPREALLELTRMLPMRHFVEKLTYTSALRLYRLPRASQLLRRLGPDWYVPGHGDFHSVVTRSPSVSRFPLALSPKTKRTRSYTSCGGTHVTSGVNTRQTPSDLTGIRTTEITAWQLDALSSRDRRGSGRRGLSRRSGRVDI
jgi:hypothetical protein